MEYFRGSDAGKEIRELVEDDEKAVISTINLAEVYRWVLRFYGEREAEEKASVMKQRCFVIDVTEEIAIMSAKIKHAQKMGLGDAIVLATANQEGAKIVTGDPDFKDLEGVTYLGT